MPPELKKRLIEELQFAAFKMKNEEDPIRKLYFFSATFGEIRRIFNWHWDRDLVLLHEILQQAHINISQRLGAIQAGRERAIGLPDEIFERLTEATSDLVDFIESEPGNKTKLAELLGRFVELYYVTSGNGAYLLERGTINAEGWASAA